jgi:hypothetical protein
MEVGMYVQTRRSPRILLAALVFAVMAFTLPVAAHHGWGGYLDNQFELTGTVETAVSLAGPHATMRVRSQGQVWDVVLAPSTRTERAGLKEGIIPLGAEVKVSGHRHRDPKVFEIKTERVTWNGRTFNVYPDRS